MPGSPASPPSGIATARRLVAPSLHSATGMLYGVTPAAYRCAAVSLKQPVALRVVASGVSDSSARASRRMRPSSYDAT